MRIQCVSCKKLVGNTTDKFNPDVRPNGSMIEIAEPYKSRGWGQTMNWTVGTCCAELFCPCCNYPLAPSGRFTLLGEPEIVEQMPAEPPEDVFKIFTDFTCPECGKDFKNKAGLNNHIRFAHKKAE